MNVYVETLSEYFIPLSEHFELFSFFEEWIVIYVQGESISEIKFISFSDISDFIDVINIILIF